MNEIVGLCRRYRTFLLRVFLGVLFLPLSAGTVAEEDIKEVLDYDIPARQRLAETAHRAGHYREAAHRYLDLLKYNRRNGLALYNLACCYARLEEFNHSGFCLRQAFECGTEVLDLIQKDEDFAVYRKTRAAQKLIQDIGDLRGKMGEKRYIIAPRALPYWLHLPPSWKVGKRCFLVIALHGNGGNESNFRHLASLFDIEDLMLAVPQGLYVHPQDGIGRSRQYTFGLPSHDRSMWKKADMATSDAVAELAREIGRLYPVDKVYLMGFSEGGVYAYQTVILNPRLFHGALVFGARLPDLDRPSSTIDRQRLQAGAGVPVFIAHGERDSVVSVDSARLAEKALKTAGYTVTLHTFDGEHGIPADVLRSGLRWIRKQAEE